MTIRPEEARDHAAIARVVSDAFADERVVQLVDLIRRSKLYVPDLALVAEDNARVVGHIMFSYVTLEGPDRRSSVLILSPLSVAPDRQRRGIGSALVRAGIDRAERRGARLVIVEGIPAYYPRFGFERAAAHGIERPDPNIPDEAFMVKFLGDVEPKLSGRVVFSPAFDAVGVGP